MVFQFENTKPDISDEDLLRDLRRVAEVTTPSRLTVSVYRQHGSYAVITIQKRFGSWNDAVEKLGVVTKPRILSDDQLLDNLRNVWTALGRQPRIAEMVPPISAYTRHPYVRKYGGWLNAMRAFCIAMDEAVASETALIKADEPRGPRDPSIRLRFMVMRRDNFKCVSCGASPATNHAIVLHVDHVVAWSKGGRTTSENLRTLCSDCNLGKSDLPAFE